MTRRLRSAAAAAAGSLALIAGASAATSANPYHVVGIGPTSGQITVLGGSALAMTLLHGPNPVATPSRVVHREARAIPAVHARAKPARAIVKAASFAG